MNQAKVILILITVNSSYPFNCWVSSTFIEPLFLKKTTKITAGDIVTKSITFNGYEPYPTKTIRVSEFLNIIDVIDSDGNSYYEVDYLGQETIFQKELNRSYIDPNKSQDVNDAPYVLSAIKTDRRFTENS